MAEDCVANARPRTGQAFEEQNGQFSQAQLESLVCQLMNENRQLRQGLAQARETIAHKDEVIMDWIAAAQAWKAVSVALRVEGQTAVDREQHPLANDPAQRSRIYRETRRSVHDQLKAQLYPPTSWRPR